MYILTVFDVCFIGLFVFERDTYNRINNVSTKCLKFSKVQMGHLHTCPLHLKLIIWCQLHHYHISYVMRKQETIHLTTFSTHNWKEILLNLSDYLTWNISQSVVICHVCLCIIINHSLSLYHCREHKPTF